MAACQTSQDKLLTQTESYIQKEFIPNLDNPKSYEAVKTVVTDTVDNQDSIRGIAAIKSLEMVDRVMEDDFNKLISKNNGFIGDKWVEKRGKMRELLYKKAIDSTILITVNIPKSPIHSITLLHIFRAQNKFGAIVLDTIKIKYDYRNKSFTHLNK